MKKSEKKRLEKQIKLQKQAEADRYRASRLKRENDELRDLVKAYGDGVDQLNRAMDAILAEVAVKYGRQIEPDVWEISIPLPSTMRNARDYKVSTRVGEDNDSYVTTVWRVNDETDDQGENAVAQ